MNTKNNQEMSRKMSAIVDNYLTDKLQWKHRSKLEAI